MIRAGSIEPRGSFLGQAADRIELDYEDRRRRRFVLQTVGGTKFLLDLPQAGRMRSGDFLVLEDGRRIEIVAANEPLTLIRASDSTHLIVLAYHLGNRHLEAQLLADRILIRRDHVIEDMVRGLGGFVEHVSEPFEPEPGAYDVHHGHEHKAEHRHDHPREPLNV